MAATLSEGNVDLEVEEALDQGCASLVPDKSRARDGGLQLSQAWTPALDQLRPSHNQGHEDNGPRTAIDSNRRNRTRRPPNFTQESQADPPTNPLSPETA
ncbi:hypothetical protein ANN_23630 [Periplaneta americana]|uniref:Uncharacterized protein n=1 Tax=Periplaneta americana TaxID=6978 RepID=A0ABQ8SLL9_PERAM|nr:hypothetical protein ANN_23630 [Periplaneta americana]